MKKRILLALIFSVLFIFTSATVDTVFAPDPPSSLDLSTGGQNEFNPGDFITLTIRITNNANYNLANILLSIASPNGLEFISADSDTTNAPKYSHDNGQWDVGNLRLDANADGTRDGEGYKELYLLFKISDEFTGDLNFIVSFLNIFEGFEEFEFNDDGTPALNKQGQHKSEIKRVDGAENLAETIEKSSTSVSVKNPNVGDGANPTNPSIDADLTNPNDDTKVDNTDNQTSEQNNNVENTNTAQKEDTEDEENDNTKNDTVKPAEKPSKNPFENPKSGSGVTPSSNQKSSSPTVSTNNATGVYNSYDPLDSSEEPTDEAKATELNTNDSSSGDSGEDSSILAGLSNPIVAILATFSLVGLGVLGYIYGIRP
jgi:uncharacterized repeat protein (TIGR01451 family)